MAEEDHRHNFLVCAGCILFVNLLINILEDVKKDITETPETPEPDYEMVDLLNHNNNNQ